MSETALRQRLVSTTTRLAASRRVRIGAGGLLLLVLVLGIVGYLSVHRWQTSLRWALEQQTHGEVSFRKLRLGWNRVILLDLEVHDSEGARIADVERVVLQVKNPWALLDTERLAFDKLALSSVRATVTKGEGRLKAPDHTLSWLRGDVPLQSWSPLISVNRVVVDDVLLVVQAPDAAVEIGIERIQIPQGVELRPHPLATLDVRPIKIRRIRIRSADQDIAIRSLEATVGTRDLSAASEAIAVGPVQVKGLRAEVSPTLGWTLPDTLVSLSRGLWLADVAVSDISVSDAVLRTGQSRIKLAEIALPTVSLTPGPTLDWSAGHASGVEVLSEKQVLAAVGTLALPQGRIGNERQVTVGTVTADQVKARVRWGSNALGVPDALFALGGLRGGGSLKVDTLVATGVDLTVASAGGNVGLPLARAELTGLMVQPGGWSVDAVTTSPGTLRYDGPPIQFRSLTMGADRVLRVAGAEASSTLKKDLTLTLPPVATQHVPQWLGGTLEGDAPYFGVAFPGFPWRPQQLVATDLLLHVEDRAVAERPTTLDLPMTLTLGPIAPNGDVALAMEGTLAEGVFQGKGHLGPDGTIVLDLDAHRLHLEALKPWLAAPLSKYGLRLVQGRGAASLRVRVKGARVHITGPVRARDLKLEGNAVLKASVNAAAGKDDRIELEVDIEGDMEDPEFSIIRSVIGAALKGLGSGLEVEDFGRDGGDKSKARSGGGKGAKGKRR